MEEGSSHPHLVFGNIKKSFGSSKALKGVSLTIEHNEVLGLIGDNGAGKSTLMKILMGVHQPTEGHIYWNGEEINIKSPKDAMSKGIEMVYQNKALAPNRTIWENVFVGREWSKRVLLDKEEMKKICLDTLSDLGVKRVQSADQKIKTLSGGERSAVALARAIIFNPSFLILDEPVTGLSVKVAEKILDKIYNLKEENITTILISHDIERAFEAVDKIAVINAGEIVFEAKTEETSTSEVISNM